jgi:glutaredoxin
MKKIRVFILAVLFLISSGIGIYLLWQDKLVSEDFIGLPEAPSLNEEEVVVLPNNNDVPVVTNSPDVVLKPEVEPIVLPKLVIYYGEQCPHCRIVENYIEDEGIGKDFDIEMKEVSQNEDNKSELIKRAEYCNIKGPIGVPFLWDGQACYSGDEDIVDYLRTKTNR